MGLFDFLRKKSPPPTQDPRERFAESLADRLRRHPGVTAVKRRTDFALEVSRAGKEATTLFLDNLFAETREVDPEERERRIAIYFSLLEDRDTTLSWDEARPHILPALRGAMGLAVPLEDPAKRQLCREVLPCLREHAVLDSETSISFLATDDQARWGVSEDEIFAAAWANLRALRWVEPTLYDRSPSPIWTLESDDSYEATRLLLPGFLASFASRVDGRPIAIVPERSTIYVAGDANPETIRRLSELALREYSASTRRMSAAIYTLDDAGKIIPYLRDGADPVATLLRETEMKFYGTEYTQQKKDLEAFYEKRGIDIFVASFSGVVNPKRGPVSFCTWAHQVDSLLPETDLIVVQHPDRGPKPLVVDFAEALRIAANQLTREPGIFPPRWRTATAVPAEIYEALRAASVDL